VGTVRRELLDPVVVLSEDHLRRLLREYVAYYNAERVHTSIAERAKTRAESTRTNHENTQRICATGQAESARRDLSLKFQ
jgi:hypothetical protein